MKRLSKVLGLFLSVVIMASTLACINVDAKMSLMGTMDGSWSQEYTLTSWSDEHTYDVSFNTDGEWTCSFASYMSSVSWKLYDLNGKQVAFETIIGGSEGAPITEIINVVVSAGQYKLVVSGNKGNYKFANLFTGYNLTDGNAGDSTSPQSIVFADIIRGAITVSDKEDWFTFDVTSGGYYKLTITTFMESIDWELYNSTLNKIDYDYVNGGSKEQSAIKSFELNLTPGKYYIKLSDSFAFGVYAFAVETLTPAGCSHSYSYKYVSPTYFKKGYTLKTCTMCGEQVKESIKAKYQIWASTSLWRYGSKASYSWGSATGAKGYQLQYAKKKNFKGGKKKLIKGRNNTSTYIYGIRKGMKLYIRVRPYKKSGGKKVYGRWSKTVIFKKIK